MRSNEENGGGVRRGQAGESGAAASARPTMSAVAAELGVSAMTVSNAYNRPDQLSAELRGRVLETARRLGYPGPDPLARGLRRRRAGALGLIYDTRLGYAVQDAAAVAFLAGVCGPAEAAGLGLLLIPGSLPAERSPAALEAALVDGLLVYSVAEGDHLVAAARQRRLPTVIVDQPRVPDLPLVGIDDSAGAAAAAAHLVELGHRRFGVISFALSPDARQGPAGPARRLAARYPVTRARLRGYADALLAAGVDWAGVPVYECAGSSRPLGRAAADALLDTHPRPTGLLATSDQLALGAIDGAAARGLAVPGELSVVGFDDAPGSDAPLPLTTIHQDHALKGRRAAELLLARLRGEAAAAPAPLPHRLVVRDSTAAPPAAG
jgi:DNA-binding LacI/PurR family transcriptional regulator